MGKSAERILEPLEDCTRDELRAVVVPERVAFVGGAPVRVGGPHQFRSICGDRAVVALRTADGAVPLMGQQLPLAHRGEDPAHQGADHALEARTNPEFAMAIADEERAA